MTMFELDGAKAKLIAYTPRRELHGEERQPAASLKFEVTLDAGCLAMFAPTLRDSLYFIDANVQGRDLASQGKDGANDLRYPFITSDIKTDTEIIGAELVIDYGLGGRSNIVLPGSNVAGFVIGPREGGVVLVEFSVACHPDKKQSGELAHMVQRDDLKITLTPPSAEADLADQASAPPLAKRSNGAGASADA